MKKVLFILVFISNLFAQYPALLFNGNCITCHNINSLNKSAPTIIEIQNSYKNAFPIKEEFVSYMVTWILNPNEETSIMSSAISKYKLMPNLAYDKTTLEEISSYIYENDFSKEKN